MPQTSRRLAFIVFAQFILIASASAQIHAPVPAQALDGAVPDADTAVGIALAFLSAYSPVADRDVREAASWKAESVGDTWEIREKASTKGAGGAYVVIIDKSDGRIAGVVQEH
jgi:hypothetical protein